MPAGKGITVLTQLSMNVLQELTTLFWQLPVHPIVFKYLRVIILHFQLQHLMSKICAIKVITAKLELLQAQRTFVQQATTEAYQEQES
jgi:hypothetical protein